MQSPPSRPLLTGIAFLALSAATFAGCTGPGTPTIGTPAASVQVQDASGAPLAFAQVGVYEHGSLPTRIFNADAQGTFAVGSLPAGFDQVEVTAPGFERVLLHPPLPATVTLAPGTDHGISLGFRAPLELKCTTPDQAPQADCGQFGEPVVEVAGDGTIWASATCCVYKAPPIWLSHDGGKTFAQLRNSDTGLLRDAYGIEGDFAMDDAGDVYFFDITLAPTVWFSHYKADGTHVWTGPWPADTTVDRPWVRAGAPGQVFIAFNTGSATDFYSSTDGGMTWNGAVNPPTQFPCPLGNLGQGKARSDLYIVAPCIGSDGTIESLKLWTSHDAGKTWDNGQKVPMPDVPFSKKDGRGLEVMNPPVGDEAGNVYVPYTHFVDAKNARNAVFVAQRGANGTWAPPAQVSTAGMNHLPWGAASQDGHAVFAWYQADGSFDHESSAQWHLMAAASLDAAAPQPHYQRVVADGSVLLNGTFDRNLGDFIETDLTPDGRVVVVYASRSPSAAPPQDNLEDTLHIRFVSSDGLLNLAPKAFKNGPKGA